MTEARAAGTAEPANVAEWPQFAIGRELSIVKLGPDGERVTGYPGWIVDAGAPGPWIAARADWVKRVVEMDGLRFVPGDRLHEFFSPLHPFNVFSVFSPEGELRGWYANVTHPTTIDCSTEPPTLRWHDLYLDVIVLPDGAITVRDEDELDESRLIEHEPELHALILATKDHLVELARRLAFPFHERTLV